VYIDILHFLIFLIDILFTDISQELDASIIRVIRQLLATLK